MCYNTMLASMGATLPPEAVAAVHCDVAIDQQPKPLPPFDCAAYSMMFFKVLPCQKKYNHDWTACPGCHPGERARRRCLLVYRYGAKVCPDMQTRGTCPRGESCYMTHGMFEYYMHPLKYKTKMCKSGSECRRHYCFFSHSPEEMRDGTSIPEEWQLQLLQDGTFSSSSTATVLACLPQEAQVAAQSAIAQLPQVMQMFEGERSNSSSSNSMQSPVQQQLAGGWQPGGSTAWVVDPQGFNSGMAAADGYGPACGLSGSPQVLNSMVHVPQQQAAPMPPGVLQYGPDTGFNSSSSQGQLVLLQHPAAFIPPAGSNGVSQQPYLDGATLQQLPVAIMQSPAPPAPPPAGNAPLMTHPGAVPAGPAALNSADPSVWPRGQQVTQVTPMTYTVAGSTAGVVPGQVLQVQTSLVLPSQGSLGMQGSGNMQAPAGSYHSATVLQAHGGPGQAVLQQGPPSGHHLAAQPQLVAASVPLSQSLLMQLQPRPQPAGAPGLQQQQQQQQVMPGAVIEVVPGAPQQQQVPVGAVPVGDVLAQQLQAMGLGHLSTGHQLQ